MQTLGYYNGKIDELDKMSVPMLDRACYFGDGVYDVALSRNHKIYALDEHVKRFLKSAELIQIHPTHTEAELSKLLTDLASCVDDGELCIYFQYSRGTAPRNHAFPEDEKPNLWVMITPFKLKDVTKTFRCITREDIRYQMCNVKTINLLPSVLAAQDTAVAGLDECILHRGDVVTECAHSNVSILKDGKLITHPTDNLILPGIARGHLIEACKHFKIPVEERNYTLTELYGADEVIVTSTSSLCMQVVEIDNKKVGGKASYTLKSLQDYLLNDFLSKTE